MPLPALPRVPSGDIRKVPMLAIVQAQLDADDRLGASPYDFDQDIKNKIRNCAAKPAACPARAPEYHDLTGDGKDELIVGIAGRDLLRIWVFTVKDGLVNRIMNAGGLPRSMEVVDGKLIEYDSTAKPGYEVRTVYAWDPSQQVLVEKSTEYGRRSPSSASPGRKS
ncbi:MULTISPECIES: hypothetical protein [unclassified Streptomyces]|uniref:hypothetical protein n=1 Tax=unclassified Streptomyces TaxID=2593676 RepID=UPI0003A1AB7C|nr:MULTISPECIES: hypothetical protein [unclassified Streptomyces]